MHSVDLNKGKSAFSLIRPDLQNLESTQKKHGFSNLSRHKMETRFAIYLLGMEIIEKLKILQDSTIFKNECTPIDAVVSHCFSWSFKDFLERLKETKLLELLVLSRIPADCLEKKKSYHDLKQVQKLIVTILQPYLNNEKINQAMEVLQDRLDYNDVYRSLENELRGQWRTFYRVSRDSLVATQFRFTIPKELLSGQLDQDVCFRIQKRYATNYGRMQVESAQIKYGKSEKTCEEELDYYERMIINEQKNHQANIAKWDVMYEEEFEIHLNQNQYMKKSVEKTKSTRAALEYQMIEHREALAAMRLAKEEERLRKIQYLRQIEEEEAERKRLAKQKRREKKKAKLKETKDKLKSASLRSLVKKPIEKSETEKPTDVKSQVKKPTVRKSVRKSEQRKSKVQASLENKSDVIEPQVGKSHESNLNVRISQEDKLAMNKSQEENLGTKKSQEEKFELKKSQEKLDKNKSEENLDLKKSQEDKVDITKSHEENLDKKKSQEKKLDVNKSQEERSEIQLSEINSSSRKITTARRSTSARKSTTARRSTSARKSAHRKSTTPGKSAQRKSDFGKSKPKGQNLSSEIFKSQDLEKQEQDDKDFKDQVQENQVSENQGLELHDLENQH